MKSIHFASPAEIVYGRHCLENNSEILSRLGKKAFIVTSIFPDGIRNDALEDVKAVLNNLGTEYAVDDGAEPNPSVESVVRIRDKILDYAPDYLIAVGGGSAMDTVKALNVLLNYPDDNPYSVLFGEGPHRYGVGGPDYGKLPFITVVTTAGTGADVAGIAVMTRNDIHTKFGTNRRSFADYSFVDSRYIASCPVDVNHAAAYDALCHAIEIYISRDSRDDFMINMMVEASAPLFADIKDHLLSNTLTAEDYDKQALFSTIQGLVIVNGLTGVPHGMGYPLSYYYHVPHGLACAAFIGEYLRVLNDDSKVEKLIALLGFRNVDDICTYFQSVLRMHVDIKVTHAQINDWTKEFCSTKWRVDRHPVELSEETVYGIYMRTLSEYIVD